MNFNYQLQNIFSDFQINKNKFLKPVHYRNKIFKVLYDTCDEFYEKNEFEIPSSAYSNLKFSEDGNYLFADCKHRIKNAHYLYNRSRSDRIFFCKINCATNFLESAEMIDTVSETLDFIQSIDVNKDTSKVYSGTSRGILTINDVSTKRVQNFFDYQKKLQNVSCCPSNLNVISIGCEDGDIFMYDSRCSSTSKIDKIIGPLYSLQNHPTKEKMLLITCESENSFYLYDLRNHQPVFSYSMLYGTKKNFSVAKFNKNGNQILLKRRYLNPLLYNTNEKFPICEFDDHGYLDNTDLKNKIGFSGLDDEFAVALSENYKTYLWEIPKKELNKEDKMCVKISSAKFILNQDSYLITVAYNYQRSILATAGYQRYIKFWTPFKSNQNPKDEAIEKKYKFSLPFGLYPQNYIYILLKNLVVNFQCVNSLEKEKFFNSFDFEYDNYFDDSIENLLEQSKNDVNLNLIKTFISYENLEGKTKNLSLYNQLKDVLSINNLRKKNDSKNYYSLAVELIKVSFTKKFIRKSVIYLKYKLSCVNQLLDSDIEQHNELIEEIDTSNIDKTEYLKELQSALDELVNIVEENNYLYDNNILFLRKITEKLNLKSFFTIDNIAKKFNYKKRIMSLVNNRF